MVDDEVAWGKSLKIKNFDECITKLSNINSEDPLIKKTHSPKC